MSDSKYPVHDGNVEKNDSKERQLGIPTHVTPHTVDKDVPSASVSCNIDSNASHSNIFPESNILIQSSLKNLNENSGTCMSNASDSLFGSHGYTSTTDYNEHQLHDLYTGNLIDLPRGYENHVEFDNSIKSFSPSQVGRDHDEDYKADYNGVIGGQSDGIEPFPSNLDFMSIFHGAEDLPSSLVSSPMIKGRLMYCPSLTSSMPDIEAFREGDSEDTVYKDAVEDGSKNVGFNTLHTQSFHMNLSQSAFKSLAFASSQTKKKSNSTGISLPLRKRVVSEKSAVTSSSNTRSTSTRKKFKSEQHRTGSKAGEQRVICFYTTPTTVEPILSHETEKSIEIAKAGCKCKNSKCLKLYCDCFQSGNVCRSICKCSECKNTEQESVSGGARSVAITNLLIKRPDAFDVREKKPSGNGCKCRNNKCLKKYCTCFSNGVKCTGCQCIDCGNTESKDVKNGSLDDGHSLAPLPFSLMNSVHVQMQVEL
jgi:hypothetical protein